MIRKVRTPDKLRRVSDALYYEIWILQSVAQGLASSVAGQSPMSNASLESFTIHTRNLLDFLYAVGPEPDDVIAEDFFPSAEVWTGGRPMEPAVLSGERRRVAKEVAHLTYARLLVTPETKPWPFLEIAQALQGAIAHFVASVSTDFLGERWAEVIRSRTRA